MEELYHDNTTYCKLVMHAKNSLKIAETAIEISTNLHDQISNYNHMFEL